MFTINVRGESPSVDPGEWRTASAWYLKEIVGAKLMSKLGLTIELIPYIRGKYGSTACSDWRRPRSFVIQIETARHTRKTQLVTLAHELVHLGQAARGDLRVRNGEIYWRPKQSSARFPDEPWEDEACAREKILFQKYEASRIMGISA